MSKVVIAEVQRRISEQLKKLLAKRIPGSFTSHEYMAETGLKKSQAQRILSQLVRAGELKHVKVPVMRGGPCGGAIEVLGYILVDKKPRK